MHVASRLFLLRQEVGDGPSALPFMPLGFRSVSCSGPGRVYTSTRHDRVVAGCLSRPLPPGSRHTGQGARDGGGGEHQLGTV